MKNKKIVNAIVIGIILLLAMLFVGTFLILSKKTEKPVTKKTTTQQFIPIEPQECEVEKTTTTSKTSPSASQKPPVVVQISPEENKNYIPNQLKQIPDLKLVETREFDPGAVVSYYEVQSFNVDGGKIIVASDSFCDGAGCRPGRYRFLQKGDNFTLLTKYSDPIDGTYGITKDYLNISDFSEMDIPELNMPEKLKDPKTGAVVKLISSSLAPSRFFDPANKILLFSVDGMNVYVDSNDANSEIYYVESIDGAEFLYTLDDQFLENQDIKWIDGKIHNGSFMIDPSANASPYNMTSCTLGYYSEAASSAQISKDELKIVAKNKMGQNIYGLKDVNSPILKAAQEQVSYARGNTHDDPADLVIFWEDPFGRLIRFVSWDMYVACGGKPVIYLYPPKKENVKVTINLKNGFSVTEPKYSNGWNVMAEPNGKLEDIATGKYYPYLFWEGGLTGYESPEDGFVVKRENIRQFFKDKLSYIGLNEKEISDFSDFWVKRMQERHYYFITFTLNEGMDKLAPLTVEPKPDTIIRVLMDYEPLDNYKDVPVQLLPKINRNGFVVIEWGGILK